MLSSPRLEYTKKTKTELLKQSFSSLIDSMRFYSRIKQLEEEINVLELERKKKKDTLDELLVQISSTIQNTKGNLGDDFTSQLSSKIPPFCKTAVELTRENVEDAYNKMRREKEALVVSEKTKFNASLSSFLSTEPFRVLETTITLMLFEGAYSAKSTDCCVNNLQYEFSLDARHNPFFGGELELSKLEEEIKLPIALSKSSFGRELKPEHARLHLYVLTKLELCEGHLIADFSHPEKQAQVKIAYSKEKKKEGEDEDSQAQASTMIITYKDIEKNVIVSSEPSLYKFFKSSGLEKALERIWAAAAELEKNKLCVTSLIFDGRDILTQLHASEQFFLASWKVITPSLALALEKAKHEHNFSDSINDEYVKSKIALIDGVTAKAILQMISPKQP